jgi:hypothetical protein
MARAIAALSNAQNAVASLATAVGTAQKAAERAGREAQRVTVDARARIAAAEADVETLRAELAADRDETRRRAQGLSGRLQRRPQCRRAWRRDPAGRRAARTAAEAGGMTELPRRRYGAWGSLWRCMLVFEAGFVVLVAAGAQLPGWPAPQIVGGAIAWAVTWAERRWPE